MSYTQFWLVVGFVGQGVFTARFLVQWLASEREGAVVVPAAFWWLSIVGAFALLSYAISRGDPVFAVGQSMGVFIYIRNLMIGSRGRPAPRRAAVPPPHLRVDAAEPAAEPAASRG
jgi:lipid-A-disaccharide synthase-like uncharacterized protein